MNAPPGSPAPETSRLVPGVCSVTFRQLPIGEVVRCAAGAGLEAIEWGGDVHVPPGDPAAAEAARAQTRDAGLGVCSYGSYLFCDEDAAAGLPGVLDAAEALGAPMVRVWAPYGVEPGADAARTAAVGRAIERVAAGAAERGLQVYLEFHAGTLTATAESAVRLLEAVGAPNLWCAWQPPYWAPRTAEEELDDLARIGSRLGPLHVYAWSEGGVRHHLADEADRWRRRLAQVSRLGGGPCPGPGGGRPVLLEFVVDDLPDNLAADAAALVAWTAAP